MLWSKHIRFENYVSIIEVNITLIERTRKRKTIFSFLLLLTLLSIASIAGIVSACTRSDFENVIGSARQTIYLLPDGSIDPASAPIQRNDNTYTFTDDLYASIVIDRENITLDGAGYTLHGPFNGTQTDLWIIGEGNSNQTDNQGQVPWTVGVDLRVNTSGITIQNLNIKNFTIGIWLWTTNNRIIQNALTENLIGILLSGTDNTIANNLFTKNRDAIFFGANQPGEIPSNITLSANSFIANARHLSGCVCVDFNNTESIHTWDHEQRGNYWDNYNGTDSNNDGLGDSPYVIDVLNQDRYPLMQSLAVSPSVTPKLPIEIVIIGVVLLGIAVVAFAKRNKGRNSTG